MIRWAILVAAFFLVAAAPARAEDLEITLRYKRLPMISLEAVGGTEVQGPATYLFPEGLSVEWSEGPAMEVVGRSVFHDTELGYFRTTLPADSLRFFRDEEELSLLEGNFNLDGRFRMEAPGFLFSTPGGRYTREGDEILITLISPFWVRGGSGFLLTGLIGIFTLILVLNSRRLRRKLAEPIELKRPKLD